MRLQDIENSLVNESPEVRRKGVANLTKLEQWERIGPTSRRLLLTALGDPDWRVRKETIATLTSFPSNESIVDDLIDALIQFNNIGLRNAAAEALVNIGQAAFSVLVQRFDSFDAGGRKIAIEVFGHCNCSMCTDTLIKAVKDDDDNVKAIAVELLGEHFGEAVHQSLIECLSLDNIFLALAALQSLNRHAVSLPFQTLKTLSSSPILKAQILTAMARSDEPSAAAEYICSHILTHDIAITSQVVLHDYSEAGAQAVYDALARVDSPTIDRLCAVAQDPGMVERRAAIRCILWARKTWTLPLLIELVREESLYIIILKELRYWGQKGLDELEALLSNAEGHTLASVVGLLSRLADEQTGRSKAALFAAYLNSNDIVVATAAAGAVARFGQDSVLSRLIEMADSPHLRVRRAASHSLCEVSKRYPKAARELIAELEISGHQGIALCQVLEHIGAPDDFILLSSALGSPLPKLRQAALKALAKICGEKAIDAISFAMTDENDDVKLTTVNALAEIGPKAAETIVSALVSAEGPLKVALIRALGQVGHPDAAAILRPLTQGPSDIAMAALEAMDQLNIELAEIYDVLLSHQDTEIVKRTLLLTQVVIDADTIGTLLAHTAWDVRLAAVEYLKRREITAAQKEQLKVVFQTERDDLVKAAIEKIIFPDSTDKALCRKGIK